MAIQSVSAQTLKSWLDAGEAVLVDVREPAEHASEAISGATLLPLSQLNADKLPVTSGKKLVIHCKAGTRGNKACEALLSNNPDLEIYNLEGGISSWQAAGYDIQRSGKAILPLDRQVQLTVGIMVLLGSLLGYFLNPTFFLLSAFFGAGLTFAGLSGTCGLALILAKMPWNQQTGHCNSCNTHS